MEKALAASDLEVTKTLYVSQFELSGLLAHANCLKILVEVLDDQICGLKKKLEEILKRINDKQKGFVKLGLEFQKEIYKNDDIRTLVLEKQYLENEFSAFDNKNMLKNSMQAFPEEILEDLHNYNHALQAVIKDGNRENNKLLKDIDETKTT